MPLPLRLTNSRFKAESLRASSFAPYLVLSLWVGIVLLLRSPLQSLMPHDEGWYAQQARWIVETGDWVTQAWWGAPVHDRMMGIQWLIAASYKLFGVSEWAARLPGAIASWGAVMLTYAIGRRCLSPQIALWGAAILAATPIWMQASRLAIQDVPLTALELLGIWALLQAETKPQRRNWGFLAGSTVGLGFMLKSIMVIPVVMALGPYLVLEHRRHRHLLNPALYLGLLVGLVPAIAWLALSVQRYGTLPLERTFGLLANLAQEDFHNVGPLYYFWNIPLNAFPWPLLAVPGVWLGWQSPYPRKALWLGYPLVLFTLLALFKTRTWYYPLQLLPFVALLAALTLTNLGALYRSRQRPRLVAGLTILLAVIGAVLIVAGGVALLQPQRFPVVGLWRYGLVAIAAGLGWLVPLAVYWRYSRQRAETAALWQGGWLLGPWGAIALLYATGLWGNYNPDVKLALATPPLREIVANHPIHAIFKTVSPAEEDMVLLTFYTPQPGRATDNWQTLAPGSYAWVAAVDLGELPAATVQLGQVRDWVLVQLP
ncbi:glycosyltransferase family 39 protein [Leptolyngbya sp. CCNP1308]|uniref:ArnT family glycosyltransferase n=1 Tax=Leptolyngbya sp. CCNP1308 TaxID=3110255 RepID=UPI002B205B14|nr:glycosyltransferase family 39 protein [Leptolyngbya sp. CCNP1308]MEA5447892.1 glycosyltransferase family 39 protein [Leptolyngbya sp. CCNP1308]